MDSVERRKVFCKKLLDEGGVLEVEMYIASFYIIKKDGAYNICLGRDYSGDNVLSRYYSYEELLVATLVISPFSEWLELLKIGEWFYGFWCAFIEYEGNGSYRQKNLDRCKDSPEYERGYNDGLIWYKSQFGE